MATRIPVLFSLMAQRKITQKQLSVNIGVSEGNISDWKSGRAAPNIEVLPKIADYLNCSIDYLLGRSENTKSQNKINLSDLVDSEKKLLAGYRELNDEGKKQADIYITEFLLQNARFTQKSDTDAAEKAE